MHILLGAINKDTNKYESPRDASKANKYICPDCKKDVIVKKGDIRVHHFAHYKDDNPCTYYTHPSESQIHKDAKLIFKALFDNNHHINILCKCIQCKINKIKTYKKESSESRSQDIKIEYRFDHNNSPKIADIAYLENNNLHSIFEIYHTHRTKSENRPEPWFEIDATDILNAIRESGHDLYIFKCVRNKICDDCIILNKQKEILKQQERERHREIERQNKERAEKLKLEMIQRQMEEDAKRIKRYEELDLKFNNYIPEPIVKKVLVSSKSCPKCKIFQKCSSCKKHSVYKETTIYNSEYIEYTNLKIHLDKRGIKYGKQENVITSTYQQPVSNEHTTYSHSDSSESNEKEKYCDLCCNIEDNEIYPLYGKIGRYYVGDGCYISCPKCQAKNN